MGAWANLVDLEGGSAVRIDLSMCAPFHVSDAVNVVYTACDATSVTSLEVGACELSTIPSHPST